MLRGYVYLVCCAIPMSELAECLKDSEAKYYHVHLDDLTASQLDVIQADFVENHPLFKGWSDSFGSFAFIPVSGYEDQHMGIQLTFIGGLNQEHGRKILNEMIDELSDKDYKPIVAEYRLMQPVVDLFTDKNHFTGYVFMHGAWQLKVEFAFPSDEDSD